MIKQVSPPSLKQLADLYMNLVTHVGVLRMATVLQLIVVNYSAEYSNCQVGYKDLVIHTSYVRCMICNHLIGLMNVPK